MYRSLLVGAAALAAFAADPVKPVFWEPFAESTLVSALSAANWELHVGDAWHLGSIVGRWCMSNQV
jgi:hypothetical protein